MHFYKLNQPKQKICNSKDLGNDIVGYYKNKWHFLTFEKTKVILRGMNFVRKKISWHSPDCF